MEDADIRGQNNVGIIAGEIDEANLRRVWTTGKVFGSGDSVGGLAGRLDGASYSSSNPYIRMSWSSADVEGQDDVGGLFGLAFPELAFIIADNWVAGNVIGNRNAGGFSGESNDMIYSRNWSSGAVSGGTNVGGFIGGDSSDLAFRDGPSYWNLDASGRMTSDGGVGIVLQTLTSVSFGDANACRLGFWRQRSFRRRRFSVVDCSQPAVAGG